MTFGEKFFLPKTDTSNLRLTVRITQHNIIPAEKNAKYLSTQIISLYKIQLYMDSGTMILFYLFG